MKRCFLFELDGFDSILKFTKVGLMGYSTDFKNVGGITIVYLHMTDGQIMKIYSDMHDIDDEWNEVGSLIFEIVDSSAGTSINPLDNSWRQIATVSKLVLEREHYMAESGICLRSISDQTLLVVAGANVETLAVRAPSSSYDFLPENDLSTYKYLPLRT